jgi:hypothetical protein
MLLTIVGMPSMMRCTRCYTQYSLFLLYLLLKYAFYMYDEVHTLRY